MIEIQYSLIITGKPTHIVSKPWHCTPHLRIYRLKRRHFIAYYVQPAVQVNNCLKRTTAIKVATTTMKIMDDFHYKWKQKSREYLSKVQIHFAV